MFFSGPNVLTMTPSSSRSAAPSTKRAAASDSVVVEALSHNTKTLADSVTQKKTTMIIMNMKRCYKANIRIGSDGGGRYSLARVITARRCRWSTTTTVLLAAVVWMVLMVSYRVPMTNAFSCPTRAVVVVASSSSSPSQRPRPFFLFQQHQQPHHQHHQYSSSQHRSTNQDPRRITALSSFWRNWIPEAEKNGSFLQVLFQDGPTPKDDSTSASLPLISPSWLLSLTLGVMVSLGLFTTMTIPPAAWAVSGGGLDYAGLDLTGQDFSNSAAYKGKDFTQVIAKGTNFAKSNLQGCRFYKAYLVNADFTGADIRGASLEDTSMDGASLKDAVAIGSYFSVSILDTATVENADFTDAQFPVKALPLLCDRPDLKGTNPTTGADTRESAMCP